MIEHDRSLIDLNTFGFEQRARHYAEAADEDELLDLLERARARDWPVFVLGGGSNLLLVHDVEGLVIRLTGRCVTVERPSPGGDGGAGDDPGHRGGEGDAVLVSVDAGADWHGFVLDMLERGHDGLENLSLIPGTVGAAPVQNIGAYGVELMDRVHGVRAWHRPSARFRSLSREDCGFGYRDSRFKRERGDWIITRVTFELGPHLPRVTGYASLAAELERRGLPSSRPSPQPNPEPSSPSGARDAGARQASALEVSAAVCAIRRSKLPDPARIGNAGSFFHNPVVDAGTAVRLRAAHPDLVAWAQPDGRVKLAAGWMIERLGYRGLSRGAVGVHSEQALVLVHSGGGSGRELLALAREMIDRVRTTYGVTLTIEPVIP